MIRFESKRPFAVALLLLGLGLAACDEPREDPIAPEIQPRMSVVDAPGWDDRGVEFYSQNLFLGGDTGPLFNPEVVGNDMALAQATLVFWGQVQDSHVQERMADVAEEIAVQNPEFVGVQEALQFVTLDPSTFTPNGNAYIDLLASLEAELASRGLSYEVAIEQPTTSSALPLVDPSSGALVEYLGFTDRVAILRRTDVEVSDATGGLFAAGIPLRPGVEINRGWAMVTFEEEGDTYHFLTTHLETQGAQPIHDYQADELLNVVTSGLDGITIVSGDMNSDAEAEPTAPSWTPTYDKFIEAGYTDVWALAPHSPRDRGFTCCNDPDLVNPAGELDQRIDFVLMRNSVESPEGLHRGNFRARVVGDGWNDVTPSGIWPSDHAGLVATISMPGN
ncbi:MAG: hypothetical protein PVJ80_12715 [Gemmatimonadota bacterium]|jgi:endonuclease/exonuclease/phosphatase family metal-dependent hydrolase